MKRKLSLLLAMVLAITMVMGMSLTTFAIEYPASVTCGQHDSSNSGTHIYVVGTYLDTEDGECVIGNVYYNGIPTGAEYASGITPKMPIIMISEWDGPGWYFFDATEMSFFKCTSTSGPASEPKKSLPIHVHSFMWQTITAPTKEADGLEGEACSCGATRNAQRLSAYAYALNEYATPMINAAKAGQTITFELGEWNSFPKAFMEKIAAKSMEGVTFVFHYKWKHVKQEITIPFGTVVDTGFDWYGPAKMAELYGAN